MRFTLMKIMDNINVFTTGLGKKKEPRTGYFTTNGDVIGGPLDDKLAAAEDVLLKGANDTRCFYFICKLDEKKKFMIRICGTRQIHH